MTLLIFSSHILFAQTQTVIGVVNNNSAQVTTDINTLSQAISQELNDGCTITDIFIDKDEQNNWHLVVWSNYNELKKTISFPLVISTSNNLTLSPSDPGYRICQTTSCIDHCNWKTCSCTDGQPGHTCDASFGNLSGGAGHIASFY